MKEIIALSEKVVVVGRNEFLTVSGTIDTNLYYVERGSLRVFVLDDQNEQIVRLGYKHDLVVSLDSFLTGKPSDLYIQAIKKTVVRIIPKAQINNFCKKRRTVRCGSRFWRS